MENTTILTHHIVVFIIIIILVELYTVYSRPLTSSVSYNIPQPLKLHVFSGSYLGVCPGPYANFYITNFHLSVSDKYQCESLLILA